MTIMLQIDAEWEVMDDTPVGLAVVPYVTTVAARSAADLAWQAEDVKTAVRTFMANPLNSNMVDLATFRAKTGGPGQPETPATRQRIAWPPAKEDSVFEEDLGNKSGKRMFFNSFHDAGGKFFGREHESGRRRRRGRVTMTGTGPPPPQPPQMCLGQRQRQLRA